MVSVLAAAAHFCLTIFSFLLKRMPMLRDETLVADHAELTLLWGRGQ